MFNRPCLKWLSPRNCPSSSPFLIGFPFCTRMNGYRFLAVLVALVVPSLTVVSSRRRTLHSSCLVTRNVFRHVAVFWRDISVSRCQLSIKSFNHISIVGICLATLLYPLFHFSVSLTIVSRFYLLVNWTWNQSRNCYSRHGRALCWAQRHDLSTSLNQTSVVGIRLDLWFQLFSILFR